MTLEAAAGKNPVSHVGKLYNLVAARVAAAASLLSGVRDASCVLVSRIGHPVDEPGLADVHVVVDDATPAPKRDEIASLLRRELGSLDALREELLAGRLPVY
jgi:S-adenosylmethionine synthetase